MTMPNQSKESEIKFFDQFGEKKDYDVFDKHGYQRILGEFKKYKEYNQNTDGYKQLAADVLRCPEITPSRKCVFHKGSPRVDELYNQFHRTTSSLDLGFGALCDTVNTYF